MRFVLWAALVLAGCQVAMGDSAVGVTQTSRFVWKESNDAFGGISGLELSQDGQSFSAIGDRGVLWTGDVLRKDGRLEGFRATAHSTLRTSSGKVVSGHTADSEGIALGADGTTYISFEGLARIAAYPQITDPATRIPRDPSFENMQGNSSLEALAIGPDGALYTMPERSGRSTRPFPVYRFADAAWTVPFSIRRDGAFLPVGADIGPDERFYLLERDFTGFGFRSRVRRFDMMGGSEETLLQTRTGTHDNLEGISVWQDDSGAIRMTMVADDNFKFFQKTEVVEYTIRN